MTGPILVIFDAGYDPMRLAYRLADLPVEILGRLRSDRVLHFPVPHAPPGTIGRPTPHGGEIALADPGDLAGPARSPRARDLAIRDSRGRRLGPGAPAADPPLGLAGSRR